MDRQGQGAYIPQELLKELSKASNRLLIGIPCERVEGECRLASRSGGSRGGPGDQLLR